MLREIRNVEQRHPEHKRRWFHQHLTSLPPEMLRFVEEKLAENARPARRFKRSARSAPRWLARLREREARRTGPGQ